MTTLTTFKKPKAILFDLDGTLADSAPDLTEAINNVRTEFNLEKLPYEALRPFASAGAPGLVKAALNITRDHELFSYLRERFLHYYRESIAKGASATQLFDGICDLLALLETNQITWGIVTNKVENLAKPLTAQIGLDKAGCLVAGDTTPYSKPHPAPLLEGAKRLGVHPQECWYVGDDLRDMQAGHAAGTGAAIAAKWGYCIDPENWPSDYVARDPWDLLALIKTTLDE
ncbi:MAG: HAD-IA family hydrolase [Oxalobacter sp.]|nr:HAD-IA family hydrolase [Oxalobacter sp.]